MKAQQTPQIDPHMLATPKVAILLSTYNGGRFLAEQIDSLIAQTHKNWVIYASDDGSTDNTLDLLEQYKKSLDPGRLNIINGPRRGFAHNFLSMTNNEAIEADYFAFCDQDDIWHPERLARAIKMLQLYPDNKPSLFCSRTALIDEFGAPIGRSTLFSRPATFKNALLQSIAGGNTMLFNAQARQLLAQVRTSQEIIFHDWLIYLLVSGCGGHVHYSDQPLVSYRQHNDNLIGSGKSIARRISQTCKAMLGSLAQWHDQIINNLEPLRDQLTPENLRIYEEFKENRQSNLLPRLSLVFSTGLYRQTAAGQISFIIAIILKRI